MWVKTNLPPHMLAIMNVSSTPPPPQPNLASSPARLLKSSSPPPHGAGVDSEVSESVSVYSQRNIANKRKGKGKETAEPLSCPPAVKIGNVCMFFNTAVYVTCLEIRNMINKDGENSLSKTCTAPPKKRQRRVNVSDYALPHEFVKQQRDHLAEIDAFDMEEEEVESLDQDTFDKFWCNYHPVPNFIHVTIENYSGR
nr:hypothetical protein CFP56_69957 [Quercus suber]